MRLRRNGENTLPATVPAPESKSEPAPDAPTPSPLSRINVTNLVLDALLNAPQNPVASVINKINADLPPTMNVSLSVPGADEISPAEGMTIFSHRPPELGPSAEPDAAPFPKIIHLSAPADQDRPAAMSFLADLATNLAKLRALHDRHTGLQRLAITDELTGLANSRYFRQFLTQIVEKARVKRFPVTLFLFDIDNFKRYNDQYGHGGGDEILKQLANLMRRCVRDHDLVARISGDEFAVIFWEKEGPRTPREPRPQIGNRTPQETQDILDRFRRLLATQDFPGLGAGGKGCLTISGGLAVYPYDAQDVNKLIEAADQQLMFGAKRSGINSIHLVGGDCLPPPSATP
jgi:GGDEF domain-containing protein